MQQTLLEFIDYLRYKVENKKFTLTELETVHLFLLNTFDVRATIDELADYYNKDKARIRTEIARKVSSKPIRRVYYKFSASIISSAYDADIKGENIAYMIGDACQMLADIICKFSCNHCRHSE